MPEPADVTINGQPYMIAPNGYERAAENPAPVKPGRVSLSTFRLGLGWVQDDQIPEGQGGGGWNGLGVHATHGGSGLEPWPASTTRADANLVQVPSTGVRAGAVAVGSNIYIHLRNHLYRTVAISSPSWSDVTHLHNATVLIEDMCYLRDDVLYSRGSAADIVIWQIGSSSASVYRVGRRGHALQGYNGQVVQSQLGSNLDSRLTMLTSGSDGVAGVDIRWLDAPIVRIGLFAGACVIATETSLYRLTGSAQRVAGAALWSGEPEPLFSHGFAINAAAGDFTFLLSLTGKLYTWLAGSVMMYDPTRTGGNGWQQVGPRGHACYGACVAAGHLVIAIETPEGRSQVWAFDGLGWWKLLDMAAPGYCWPISLNGAGGHDALVFVDNSSTYTLLRLVKRSNALPSYAASGTWTFAAHHGRQCRQVQGLAGHRRLLLLAGQSRQRRLGRSGWDHARILDRRRCVVDRGR